LNDAAPAPESTDAFDFFANYLFASENRMTGKVYNILFLCTGNSARSILAESLLNHWGRGKFRGFSAGSFPKGQVHPMAMELLERMNLPTEDLRSKSWDELAMPGSPQLDFIVTVCDDAAGEVCPVWPGIPMTAHWGIADPAAADGTDADKALAFRRALKELEGRIKLLIDLPIASLDRMKLQESLRAIGKQWTAADP
jgi:arsenate reductase